MDTTVDDFAHWVGFEAKSSEVIVVHFKIGAGQPATVELDDTWPIQKGDRPQAYSVMHQRVADYLREHRIDGVVIMGSGVSGFKANKGLLQGAEVRGVVASASASTLQRVVVQSRASASKSSSRGKVDRYVSDETYWSKNIANGKLRVGSRSIAYLLLTHLRGEANG